MVKEKEPKKHVEEAVDRQSEEERVTFLNEEKQNLKILLRTLFLCK